MKASLLAKHNRSLIVLVSVAWVGIASLAAGCAASRQVAAKPATSSAPLYTEQSAAVVADRMLAAVPLPGKTRRVPQSPPSVAKRLRRSRNSENSPKSVDRHAFWISTERPASVLAFLAAHGPGKLYTSGYGGTAGRTERWWEILDVPVASPSAGPRELFAEAVPGGAGRYALRIDAVAAWHRPRPEGSFVPVSARWLKVTITEPALRALNPGERSHARTTVHSYTTTAAPTVLAAARAVNELPIAEPGGAEPSCPAMSVANTYGAPRFRLSFRASAKDHTVATVNGRSGYVCERGGAATARITTVKLPHGLLLSDHLNGVTVPHGEGLTEHIEAAFGHVLHLVPEG
jgi:hypothetical protein